MPCERVKTELNYPTEAGSRDQDSTVKMGLAKARQLQKEQMEKWRSKTFLQPGAHATPLEITALGTDELPAKKLHTAQGKRPT